MTTNNAYNKTFKTKREEYEEKLKQRSENEQWIFGNTFGRPGGGAPLRDKKGNVIPSLRTISNGNIFKYDAQEFTKGENNNYNLNNSNNINVNNNEINVNKVINDPFIPFRQTINQFDPNNNQGFIIPQNNIPVTEEQKKDMYLNQFTQNPYLIQMPDGNYGILAPYPLIQPMPNTSNINLNYNNNLNNSNNLNNYPLNQNISQENIINSPPKEDYLQQRPYSSNNINMLANTNNNFNPNNNNNINNINNINNTTNISNINNKTNSNFNTSSYNNLYNPLNIQTQSYKPFFEHFRGIEIFDGDNTGR